MGAKGTVLGRGVLANDGNRSHRSRLRLLFAAVVIGAVAVNVFAANITFTGATSLGTGSAVIAACDTDGFSVKSVTSWVATDTAFKVASVVVGSGAAATASQVINTACAGKTLDGVVLSNGTSIGRVSSAVIAATNVTGATPLTLALSAPVSSSLVDQIVFEVKD